MSSYEWGMFCGRLQHIHKGHESVIEKGLTMCNRLLVMVGSSQESGTVRNPFDAPLRRRLIEDIYAHDRINGGRVTVRYLPDMTDENDICPEWGRFVLNRCQEEIECLPKLMVYGNDEGRSDWFSPEDIQNIDQLVVGRSTLKVSATEMRSFLLTGSESQWREYANPRIWRYFGELRERLLMIPVYKEEYERLMGA